MCMSQCCVKHAMLGSHSLGLWYALKCVHSLPESCCRLRDAFYNTLNATCATVCTDHYTYTLYSSSHTLEIYAPSNFELKLTRPRRSSDIRRSATADRAHTSYSSCGTRTACTCASSAHRRPPPYSSRHRRRSRSGAAAAATRRNR